MTELHYGQPIHPIILVVVDIDPEVLLNLLIDPLCLPIGLRIVCHAGVPLYANESIQVFHEEWIKLKASVMDNFSWDTVESKQMVPVDFSHALGGDHHGGKD